MKIYNESGQLLTGEPDLTAGYLTDGTRVTTHHEERLVVMDGTDGLRRRVPAYDDTEAVQVYHAYTAAELAAQNAPTNADRLAAAEAAIIELAGLLAGGDI